MGLFETYRIAGGERGMAHFLAQFGPALHWPWTRLTDVPDLDDALVARIAAQSDAQSGHRSIRDLERLRDENLVGMMRALRRTGSGAGGTLLAHEAALPAASGAGEPPVTVDRVVPPGWADYNGHMNEARYLEAASQATDRVMAMVGADAGYVAGGQSYFTVETHLRHLAEVRVGERLRVTSQVVRAEGKKLHLFHRVLGPEGAVAATVETLLIHVDLGTRASSRPLPAVAAAAEALARAHAALPPPDGLGRAIG